MLADDLKNKLSEYHGDDGFEVPKEILSHANCDLALEIFYLVDGYRYLEKTDENAVSPGGVRLLLPQWEREEEEGRYSECSSKHLSLVDIYTMKKERS